MNNTALVSILMNCYNGEKYLKEAIEMEYTLDKIFTKNPALKQKNERSCKHAYAKIAYYRARYLIQIEKKSSAIKVLSKYKALNIKYFALFLLVCLPSSIWQKLHIFKQKI